MYASTSRTLEMPASEQTALLRPAGSQESRARSTTSKMIWAGVGAIGLCLLAAAALVGSGNGGVVSASLGRASSASLGGLSDLPSQHMNFKFPGKSNKFCTVADNNQIECTKDVAQGWEEFSLSQGDGDIVYIKSDRNGKFCADDSGNRIVCDQDQPNDWAKFKIELLGDGSYSLKGVNSNKFCKEDSGKIMCNSDNKEGGWEKITMTFDRIPPPPPSPSPPPPPSPSPPVVVEVHEVVEGTCGVFAASANGGEVSAGGGQCMPREIHTYPDGNINEYEYLSDCKKGGLGCVGETTGCRKCHVGSKVHPLGYPRCPQCVCDQWSIASGCAANGAAPEVPAPTPAAVPVLASPPSPSPPPPKLALTDDTLKAAITACLATNPVDGLCVDSAYGPMPDWDTSKVTNMNMMFKDATAFNADISKWDTSNVNTMFKMFEQAVKFNTDIGGWDTSKVTQMRMMFYQAAAFNADVSKWDTSKVTAMDYMFGEATAFNADISGWDVSQVKNMDSMFRTSASFNADISRWDTSKVTSMTTMFYEAAKFNADISGWDVSKVTTMNMMFQWATAFNADITGWKTPLVFGGNGAVKMFAEDTAWLKKFKRTEQGLNLGDGPPSKWAIPVLTDGNVYSQIRYCLATNPADGMCVDNEYGAMPDWDVSRITTMKDWFKSLNDKSFNPDISKWDTSKVTDMTGMFYNAPAFNADISGWDVSKVTKMDAMFQYARKFNADISGWDVSKVTNMDHMFQEAEMFNADISTGWTTPMSPMFGKCDTMSSTCPGMSLMFYGATAWTTKFERIDGREPIGLSAAWNGPPLSWADKTAAHDGNFKTAVKACLASNPVDGLCADNKLGAMPDWDTSKVTNMGMTFWTKDKFNADISKWDTSKVTDMSRMFGGADAFNADISGWDTSEVKTMEKMFWRTVAFNADIGGWNTAKVTNMDEMFASGSGSAFNADIGRWDTSEVTSMYNMFEHSKSFNADISGWNAAKVTNMERMFYGAKVFNADISGWKTPVLTQSKAGVMFRDATAWKQTFKRIEASSTDPNGWNGPPSAWTKK